MEQSSNKLVITINMNIKYVNILINNKIKQVKHNAYAEWSIHKLKDAAQH